MAEPIAPEQGGFDYQLVRELFVWAGVDEDARWRKVAEIPEACEKIAAELKAIANLPIAQADTGAIVPFVFKNQVINLRPLVVPVLVAAVVKVAVAVAPTLDSEILPWLDVVALLEKVRHIYRRLDDDESDVFAALSNLYTTSTQAPSVTDPARHPTAAGVRNWFEKQGYQAPPNSEAILESLAEKGAVVREGDLFLPSFLGAGPD